MGKLSLQPITLDEAKAFIRRHHSHHRPTTGWKFGIAVNDGERVVGVAVVGHPQSRVLQAKEPYTAEVLRNCTDGTPHVASKLYAACWRACRAMGYTRVITYLLREEAGTSVKAAGYRMVVIGTTGEAYVSKGGSWSRPSRPRVDTHPTGQKTLWEVAL